MNAKANRKGGETPQKEQLIREYRYIVDFDPEHDYYIARCVELGYVTADGKTEAEAIKNVKEVALQCLDIAEEDGDPYPVPLCRRTYGGKILLRITPEKHKDLAEEADRLGISMNDYIARKLA